MGQLPKFNPQDFSANMGLICSGSYGGKKPEELKLGFVLTAVVPPDGAEAFFVASRPGQYASAVIIDWWKENIGEHIEPKHEELLRAVYAQHWDDKPDTGKHPIIDFLRFFVFGHRGTVTITRVDDVIEGFKERGEVGTSSHPYDVCMEAIVWQMTVRAQSST